MTKLNDRQKWAVSSFLIKNRNYINEEGKPPYWRVSPALSAEEVAAQNIVPGKIITAYSCIESMRKYFLICELTGNMPFQTPKDTVREDMLTAELAKKVREIQDQVETIKKQQDQIEELREVIDTARQAFIIHLRK